jgi:tRNA(His) 5'-end guanylyltransferase
MSSKDPLGDLIKGYERDGEIYPSGDKPLVIRLDGKNFSKWTKGLRKPYDIRLSNIMINVTEELVKYSGADIGYTQSDEISLVLSKPSENSELFFGGRHQKLASVLASLATYHFNNYVNGAVPIGGIKEKAGLMALFDARVFEVPDKETAAKALLWRAKDCRRNSVSCLAQVHFSHKELQGKSTKVMIDMLAEIDEPWDLMPDFYKDGMYIRKEKVKHKMTEKELLDLPPKHDAHKNPDMEFERTVFKRSSNSIIDSENIVNFF